jgi:hypothetical protein
MKVRNGNVKGKNTCRCVVGYFENEKGKYNEGGAVTHAKGVTESAMAIDRTSPRCLANSTGILGCGLTRPRGSFQTT